jgi:hypothetical protein
MLTRLHESLPPGLPLAFALDLNPNAFASLPLMEPRREPLLEAFQLWLAPGRLDQTLIGQTTVLEHCKLAFQR